ncbi:MAG: hypothetical protein ACRYGK_02275 [Janthinobacterium lividum]
MKPALGRVGRFIERKIGLSVGKTDDGQYAYRETRQGGAAQVSVGNKGLRLQGDGPKRSGEIGLSKKNGLLVNIDSHERSGSGRRRSTVARAGQDEQGQPGFEISRTQHRGNRSSRTVSVSASHDREDRHSRLHVERTVRRNDDNAARRRSTVERLGLEQSPDNVEFSTGYHNSTNARQRQYEGSARTDGRRLTIDATANTTGVMDLDSANARINTRITGRSRGFDVSARTNADLGVREGPRTDQTTLTASSRLRHRHQRLEQGQAVGVVTARTTNDLRPLNMPMTAFVETSLSGQAHYAPPPGPGWTATRQPMQSRQGFNHAPFAVAAANESDEDRERD